MEYPHLYLPNEAMRIAHSLAAIAHQKIWLVSPKIDGMNIRVEGRKIHLREGGVPNPKLERAIRDIVPAEIIQLSDTITVFCEVFPQGFFHPQFTAYWDKTRCYILDLFQGRMLPPDKAREKLGHLSSIYVGHLGTFPCTLEEAVKLCRVPKGQEGVVIKAYFGPGTKIPSSGEKHDSIRLSHNVAVGMIGIKYKPRESNYQELEILVSMVGKGESHSISVGSPSREISAEEIKSVVWTVIGTNPELADFTTPHPLLEEVSRLAKKEAESRGAKVSFRTIVSATAMVLAQVHNIPRGEIEELWKEILSGEA